MGGIYPMAGALSGLHSQPLINPLHCLSLESF